MECKIIDSSGSEVAKLAKENAEIKLSPEGKDTTVGHMIDINFKDLVERFIPGNKLIVKYPLIARNPQPNIKYETPVSISSYTLLPGPAYNDTTPEIPVIGIQYAKRKVKTAKSISPAGEGSFKVIVKISNKGTVELENISVVETVPSGFKAGDFSPAELKPGFCEEANCSKLTWNINRIDAGGVVKISYISQGSGEYPRTEPEVIIAEPDSIKSGSSPLTAQDQAFRDKKAGFIIDIFENLKKKLNGILSGEAAADAIEAARDNVIKEGKSSPALHEIMMKANEIRKLGDKKIVGPDLDAMINEIDGWIDRLT